ncbi:MAG: MerR family transcriptional regulator [Deltaproteobacteria bacterium]|nr:MerR family transcriptional regulator [Deltaproteobacteria bacterium]
MRNRTHLNSQVSEIVGITQRQVLSWTEKGLIVPFKESTGVGTKRGYDYINLLEFGLCKRLFSLGFGFRAVKKMLNDMRNIGMISNWANDFTEYYREIFERHKSHLDKQVRELESKGDIKKVEKLKEFKKKFIQESCYYPDKPRGVIAYFFSEEGGQPLVIPWDMETILNLNIIKQAFIKNDSGLLVDISKIKEIIDSKL